RALRAVGVIETFDEREFPQRAGAIEPGGRDRLQHVEQRALGSGRGKTHAPEMEVEVEGVFDGPARRSEPERWRQDALPQARDEARGAVETRAQAVEIRWPVEHRDRDDRRTQDRVLLHVPQ